MLACCWPATTRIKPARDREIVQIAFASLQIGRDASIIIMLVSLGYDPEDDRDQAPSCSLMHVHWHGHRITFDMEILDEDLPALLLSSKLIFDRGPGNAVKASSIIMFCVVDQTCKGS